MNLEAELPRNENQLAATPKLTSLRLKSRISSIGDDERSSVGVEQICQSRDRPGAMNDVGGHAEIEERLESHRLALQAA